MKKYSHIVSNNPSQPAAKAMLYGIGLSEKELNQPFIGIASTGYEGNPCNMHLNNLSTEIKENIIIDEGNKKLFIGHGDGLGKGDYFYKFVKKIFTSKICQWAFSRLHPNRFFTRFVQI